MGGIYLQAKYLDQFTYCRSKNTKAQPGKALSGEGALFVPGFKIHLRKRPFFSAQESFCKTRETESHCRELESGVLNEPLFS